MLTRLLAASSSAALVSALLVVATTPASQGAEAPGGPGHKATWTEADKTGFGTSRSRGSNVWFTLQRGRTSEVFYPDLSTPSVRSLELVVTGDAFTDRESTDMRHRTTRPDAGSLRFTQCNTDQDGRYRIVETFVTDPRRDALDVHVRLTPSTAAATASTRSTTRRWPTSGMDDSGRTTGNTLVADDGARRAARWWPTRGSGSTSTGYLGTSDGPWRDLKDDQRLDHTYDAAGPGNIVQVGRIAGVTGRPGHRAARLSLGFGRDCGGRPSYGAGCAPYAVRAPRSGATTAAGMAGSRSLKGVPASAAADPPAVPRLGDGGGGGRGQAAPRRLRRLADRALGVG